MEYTNKQLMDKFECPSTKPYVGLANAFTNIYDLFQEKGNLDELNIKGFGKRKKAVLESKLGELVEKNRQFALGIALTNKMFGSYCRSALLI